MKTFVENFMNTAADLQLWGTVKLMLKYVRRNSSCLSVLFSFLMFSQISTPCMNLNDNHVL